MHQCTNSSLHQSSSGHGMNMRLVLSVTCLPYPSATPRLPPTLSVPLFDLIRAHFKKQTYLPTSLPTFAHRYVYVPAFEMDSALSLLWLFGLSDSSTAVIQSESSDEGSGKSANSSQADSIAACILSIVGDILTIDLIHCAFALSLLCSIFLLLHRLFS